MQYPINLTMRPTITLGMIVKNEEFLIDQCLKSVKSLVTEIIVVDTGSTDRTIEIAKKHGARIIHHQWDGKFSSARNLYIRHATGAWVLTLDGDEQIAAKDIPRLKNLIDDRSCVGYYLPWRDYSKDHNLLEDWHPNTGQYPEEEKFSNCPGSSRSGKQLRLFRRLPGVSYSTTNVSAHVSPLDSLNKLGGKIKTENAVIHHFQYLKGANEFIFNKQKERLESEKKQIRLTPTAPLHYLNVGKTFFSLGKDAQAIQYFKRAIKLNPRDDEPYFLLGLVYQEMGKYEFAIRNFKKAISIRPESSDAWTVLGMVYDLKGEPKKAEQTLKKALRLHPSHLLAHNAIGIAYQNQGRLREAEQAFKKALKLHPQFSDAFFNLGTLYESMNDLRLAKKYYLLSQSA